LRSPIAFKPTKFAYIQPDIQFLSRPGGTGAIDDAVVIGAQMGVSF
jgi:porin